MLDYIIYIMYKIIKSFILIIPQSIIKLFLDALASFLYIINYEHKRYAFANLDFVYKDTMSKNEKIKIVKESYTNLVYNLYEFMRIQTLDMDDLNKQITPIDDYIIKDAIKDKRKIIIITAHYGNWEYGGTWIPLIYKPATLVGRLMNNKYFNEELYKSRTRSNTIMVTKKEAARALVKALKDDRIAGFVIDQHNSSGIEVEFFNAKVLQTDAPSKLAIKFNAIIIPVFFKRTAFGKYDAIFTKGIEPSEYQGENQVKDLTQAQASIMEKQIRSNPSQWFWQHRRFKIFNPELYIK